MVDEDTDVFDDVEEEVETEVEAETETETDVKDESKDKPKEDASTSEDESNDVAGLRKAIVKERERRQKAEAKLKQQERVPVKVPDPVTDPDGYTNYVLGEGDVKTLRVKIELSQEMMRDLHEDYDDAEKVFISLISDEDGNITDRKLLDEFNASKSPAKFAYNKVKEHQKILERTSDDYETKIRNDERKKLLAQLEAEGLDATDLPDFTNAAASISNTDPLDKETGDRIDAFDD